MCVCRVCVRMCMCFQYRTANVMKMYTNCKNYDRIDDAVFVYSDPNRFAYYMTIIVDVHVYAIRNDYIRYLYYCTRWKTVNINDIGSVLPFFRYCSILCTMLIFVLLPLLLLFTTATDFTDQTPIESSAIKT